MARDLDGNVAVITGGASSHGIGAATGRLLAGRGCRVVLTDIDADQLNSTVRELSHSGLDVTGISADVSDFSSMSSLSDTVFERYGRVDIAFLNAGIGGGAGYFGSDDLGEWHRVVDINFFGILHGIKAFVPRMIEQGTVADVIGTTSGAGAVGVMYETPGYSASKAAVLTLLEGLYGKLRDLESKVRVHALLPPLTRTNLAGGPELMTFVQQAMAASGVPAVLAEPAEVAVTVLECIESGRFWAYHDHEADRRLYDGKFGADIAWQHGLLHARAKAMTERTSPDPYLWGKLSG